MLEKIYVTKKHYENTTDKISALRLELKTIRENKKYAYDNCGDGWHDNPYYIQLLQDEKMNERRLDELLTSFSKYTIFDYTKIPSHPSVVSLGTKVTVEEEYLEKNTSKVQQIRIVPLGDEERPNAVLYYTPRVRPLLGKTIGEIVPVKIPSGTISTQILSIEKDIVEG